MSMHLVTGYAGEEHITAADQGAFNAAFFGTGQYVMEAGNMCEASITSNSNVRILDGDILMKGRHIRIKPNTYEDVNISTGTAGVNRNDLIVVEYNEDKTTGIETIALKVIKGTESEGTPSDPVYTDGDILGDATFNQMPLYRVKLEGVVLSSIEPLFDTISNYQSLAEKYKAEFKEDCETHLNSLGVLDTMEEVVANTQENQLAGALAIKELSVEVENCFQSVSDGKVLVASAITDKGVSTDATATFEQMAANISSIKTSITPTAGNKNTKTAKLSTQGSTNATPSITLPANGTYIVTFVACQGSKEGYASNSSFSVGSFSVSGTSIVENAITAMYDTVDPSKTGTARLYSQSILVKTGSSPVTISRTATAGGFGGNILATIYAIKIG